jgi:hypothetical protein
LLVHDNAVIHGATSHRVLPDPSRIVAEGPICSAATAARGVSQHLLQPLTTLMMTIDFTPTHSIGLLVVDKCLEWAQRNGISRTSAP